VQHRALENKIRRRFPDLGVTKLTQKLERWWLLDFVAFQNELMKSYKTSIPVVERDDWQTLFENAKAAHQTFTVQIALLEQELNAAVYGLFGLTDEEIKLIEIH
jgi:hypothetical protein